MSVKGTDPVFPKGPNETGGLTVLQLFAAFALKGLSSAPTDKFHLTDDELCSLVAKNAVERAKCLIKALNDSEMGNV